MTRVEHEDLLSVEVLVNRADSENLGLKIVSYCLLICQNLNQGVGKSKVQSQGLVFA